jgi:hypothetical protein
MSPHPRAARRAMRHAAAWDARCDTTLLGMLFGILFVQLTQLKTMKVLCEGRFAITVAVVKAPHPISSGNCSWTTHFVVGCTVVSGFDCQERKERDGDLRVCILASQRRALVFGGASRVSQHRGVCQRQGLARCYRSVGKFRELPL